MSTKSTIACGEGFHFYHECFDFEDNVYLELDGEEPVMIPLAVWETIRRTEPYDFTLAALTDDELLARVTREVDERIGELEKFRREHPGEADGLPAWVGAGVYGDAGAPREEQIRLGMEWHRERRACQREVIARMKRHEITNGAVFGFDFRAGTREVMAGSVTDGTGEPSDA